MGTIVDCTCLTPRNDVKILAIKVYLFYIYFKTILNIVLMIE